MNLTPLFDFRLFVRMIFEMHVAWSSGENNFAYTVIVITDLPGSFVY